jgi:hypothetical protein
MNAGSATKFHNGPHPVGQIIDFWFCPQQAKRLYFWNWNLFEGILCLGENVCICKKITIF